MSWSDYYPIFTEELIDEYDDEATDDEKDSLQNIFGVTAILNAKDTKHIVAVSLFGDHPVDRVELLGVDDDSNVFQEEWTAFIREKSERLLPFLQEKPDVSLRIYLANYLRFLTPLLIDMGFEIHLMHEGRSRCSLPLLWPVLALNEVGKLVTISAFSDLKGIAGGLDRTGSTAQIGLKFWRFPRSLPDGICRQIYYPIEREAFGGIVESDVNRLLRAFVWCGKQGKLSENIHVPGFGEQRISWSDWRHPDFDRCFLAMALFPRIASSGVVTFSVGDPQGPIFAIDIEYVTWANSSSEVVVDNRIACC